MSHSSARPAITTHGLALALVNVLRVCALAVGVLALAYVRTTGSAIAAIVAMALVLGVMAATRAGRGEMGWWAAYVLGFVAFVELRNLAAHTGAPVRFLYPAAAEVALFGRAVSAVWQDAVYRVGDAGALIWVAIVVHLSYFLVPHSAAFLLWWKERPRFHRFVVASLVIYYAGVLICAVLPTAPPWLAASRGLVTPVHRVLDEVLRGTAPNAYAAGQGIAGGNPVAAMPSLHTAIAVLIALVFWRGSHWRRWLAVSYAVAMPAALVLLGEHYLADVLAGAGLAVAAWIVAARVVSHRGATAAATVCSAGAHDGC